MTTMKRIPLVGQRVRTIVRDLDTPLGSVATVIAIDMDDCGEWWVKLDFGPNRGDRPMFPLDHVEVV